LLKFSSADPRKKKSSWKLPNQFQQKLAKFIFSVSSFKFISIHQANHPKLLPFRP